MPRVRGESFRRAGATSTAHYNENCQQQKAVLSPSLTSSASSRSPQIADGTTIHSSNDWAVSVTKNHVPFESKEPLQTITPHEIKGSHRTKSRSRSRKKKRNNEKIILCADDSARLFKDNVIGLETGRIEGISQYHDVDLVKSPICAGGTPAAKKSPQNKDVTSSDIETKQIDCSQVTPDGEEKNNLDECEWEFSNAPKVDNKGAFDPNLDIKEKVSNYTTDCPLRNNDPKARKRGSKKISSAKNVVDINEDCRRGDINDESKVEDNKEVRDPNTEIKHKNKPWFLVQNNASKDRNKPSSSSNQSNIYSAEKVIDVTFPGGDMIENEKLSATSKCTRTRKQFKATKTHLRGVEKTDLRSEVTSKKIVNAWKTFFISGGDEEKPEAFSTTSECTSKQTSYTDLHSDVAPNKFVNAWTNFFEDSGHDTNKNETHSIVSEWARKRKIYTKEMLMSLNTTPNHWRGAKDTDLHSDVAPNKFVDAWTNFFVDFDAEQRSSTTKETEMVLSKIPPTKYAAHEVIVIDDSSDSDTAPSKTVHNNRVKNIVVRNTSRSKSLDHIITKEEFFSKRCEIRKRYEMLSADVKPEAINAATCKIFNMSPLAIITDFSLVQGQTVNDVMCPCSCRSGAMLDVVLCNTSECGTLRWTQTCSVSAESCDEKKIIDSLRNTPEYASNVWEAHTLQILHERVTKWLNASVLAVIFPTPEALRFECGHNGATNAVLDLLVSPVTGLLPQKSSARMRSHVKIFGTLQDIFNLHVQYCVGPIPESVIACLILQIVEIITVLHHCGVAHNSLGLESFVLVQEDNAHSSDEINWSLRLVDLGTKASILKCHLNDHDIKSAPTNKELNHSSQNYEKDMHSLAGIVQALLLGGATLIKPVGDSYETLVMPVISDNYYLRGRLAWKELINAFLKSKMGLIDTKFISSPNRINYSRCQLLQNERDQLTSTSDLTHAIALIRTVSNTVEMIQYLDQALQHHRHTIKVANKCASPLTKPANCAAEFPKGGKISQEVSSFQCVNDRIDGRRLHSSIKEGAYYNNKLEKKCASISRVHHSLEFDGAPNEKIRRMSQLVASHEKEIALYKSKIDEMERIILEKNRLLTFEQSWREKELSQVSAVSGRSPQHHATRITGGLSPHQKFEQEFKLNNSRSSRWQARNGQTDWKAQTKLEELTPDKRKRSSQLREFDCNFPQQQQKQCRGRVIVCLDDSSDSDDDSEFG